ncbi:uncharacterized protein Z519_10308 [Cladophialophora bantiana CBS 173.52]|uniref:Ankyrin repeat protein n=1 Tax=Cladophialophora bantiana (strain ATCC 10958 / CBS 173.52 / CDC B-1940 / NIH 8579) TaxID=1442370 RepID=A0A0D2HW70_CLAB1|nr:uncharacterized protein Z519_10308 [Cladophialophora bantiana CBS 173.52]KIW88824.1 hypothetical protein Z519_10308 [Cladophialophora bantiana CBS 173.52]
MNHEEVMEALVDAGADVNAQQKGGFCARASIIRAYEKVKSLVDAGANVNSQDNRYQPSALHLNVVMIHVDAGANIDAQDREGTTPLIEASRMGDDKVMKILADAGVKVEALHEDYDRAIIEAWHHGHYKVVKILFRKGRLSMH